MDAARRVTVSKFLSLHLRHAPQDLGLALEDGGWVDLDALMEGAAARGFPLTEEDVREVVRTSDKQRFSLDDATRRIRANQGHSVPVDLQLEAAIPPDALFHGTTARVLDAIRAEGLRRMARHHVHLSADEATARRVGARRGAAIVVVVDAAAMCTEGRVFFRATNGVWLVEEVPARFLRFPGG
ncbi:MAG: RNA 2'-phosphotransferase [Deltaproteobacteria bacterium]|nr:RNA 2'-phosphotransferase [Deltaproteobacteria bacterium]